MRNSFGLLVLSLSVACGEEVPGEAADAGSGDAGAVPLAERYLPLATGATWSWDVSDPSGVDPPYVKVSAVGPLEDVGGDKAGTSAFRVTTQGSDGETVSWQELAPAAVLRHRERTFGSDGMLESDQVFNPYKLRIDERADRLVVGAGWTEAYGEVETNPATGESQTVTKVETWLVEGVDVPVTVPAGTFSCLQVRRFGDDDGDSEKTYWFAKGVGKVQELGNKREQLKAFSLP